MDEKLFFDIKQFHDEQALIGTGGMLRENSWWKRIERRESNSHFAAIYEKGEIVGYIRYLIEDLTFHIKDFITKNLEAEQGLWRFIIAHVASVTKIFGKTANHTHFGFHFQNPQFNKELSIDTMFRIVDVEKLLQNYNWLILNQDLYIEIEDPFAPWNDKAFHITKKGIFVVENSDFIQKNELFSLPITIFSSLMVGYLSIEECIHFAKHKIDRATIKNWKQALGKSAPAFNEYF